MTDSIKGEQQLPDTSQPESNSGPAEQASQPQGACDIQSQSQSDCDAQLQPQDGTGMLPQPQSTSDVQQPPQDAGAVQPQLSLPVQPRYLGYNGVPAQSALSQQAAQPALSQEVAKPVPPEEATQPVSPAASFAQAQPVQSAQSAAPMPQTQPLQPTQPVQQVASQQHPSVAQTTQVYATPAAVKPAYAQPSQQAFASAQPAHSPSAQPSQPAYQTPAQQTPSGHSASAQYAPPSQYSQQTPAFAQTASSASAPSFLQPAGQASTNVQPAGGAPVFSPVSGQTASAGQAASPGSGQAASFAQTAGQAAGQAPVFTHSTNQAASFTQPRYTPAPPEASVSRPAPQPAFEAPLLTKKQNKGRGMAFLTGLIGVFLGALLSVGVLYVATSGFSFTGTVATSATGGATGGSNLVITPPSQDASLAEAVAAKVIPSVVNIDVYATSQSDPMQDFFNSYGGSNRNSSTASEPEMISLGSGVILTTDGYILTNYHVLEGGTQFMVSLGDAQIEAKLVGSDPSSDLAVIKVDMSGLTPIDIGNSDEVKVGEWVMAAGSPYGLEKSVSSGIVSALYRSTAMQSQEGLSIYANLIQTDAAINPGNSGGALVNSKGELIGINTLINSYSGSNAGVGFAVPINYAFNIAQQIIEGKDVTHPFLGVTLYTVSSSNASQLGTTAQSGAYVESVQPGSPAEQAGLKRGDVITMLDKKSIATSAELIIEIRGHAIGSTVTLGVNRDGRTEMIEVVLTSTTN